MRATRGLARQTSRPCRSRVGKPKAWALARMFCLHSRFRPRLRFPHSADRKPRLDSGPRDRCRNRVFGPTCVDRPDDWGAVHEASGANPRGVRRSLPELKELEAIAMPNHAAEPVRRLQVDLAAKIDRPLLPRWTDRLQVNFGPNAAETGIRQRGRLQGVHIVCLPRHVGQSVRPEVESWAARSFRVAVRSVPA